MIRSLLIALAVVVGTTGCVTPAKDPRVVAFEAGKRKVELDPRVLRECPDLPALEDGKDTVILENARKITQEYRACRTGKADLNKIIKDAFNIDK